MNDIEAGKVDCIVVYKVDRLSRSLSDFAKMMEILDRKQVSFVSVTQHFNTSTSMGRLTLNILLSFAQFEREVIAERVRDKFASSRMRGMWMGGMPPLGYDVKSRRLIVNSKEADLVKVIYNRFLQLGSTTRVCEELRAQGVTTKSWFKKDGNWREGAPINNVYLRKILRNRVYLGEAKYKTKHYKGEHEAIIDATTFDKAQSIFKSGSRWDRAAKTRSKTAAPLKGIIYCGACGRIMMMSAVNKTKNRQYRYYVCNNAVKNGYNLCPVKSLPAGEIEQIVYGKIRHMLASPEVIAKTVELAAAEKISEQNVITSFQSLDNMWQELFPIEQNRILQLLIEKVTVNQTGLDLTIRIDGFKSLANELTGQTIDGARDAA